MKHKLLPVCLIVAALLGGAWFFRDTALVRPLARATGLGVGDATQATGATLQAAGVHKCQGAGGVTYLDRPCPKGSRELAANGGAVTVMSFPKSAAPAEPGASGVRGSRIVEGMRVEERDRLREKQIDDAANR